MCVSENMETKAENWNTERNYYANYLYHSIYGYEIQ